MKIASISTDLLYTRAWNFLHLEQCWIYRYSPLSAGAWRVHPSVNASSSIQMRLGTVKIPHIPSFSPRVVSTEITQWYTVQRLNPTWNGCCTHALPMQGGCSCNFRVSQGTVSAAISPRTTGNAEHSCYSRYNLFFHCDIWAGKKVRTVWLFSGMPGNCRCVFMGQYPNVDREINVCRTPVRCAGSLCDFVCPKSVSREPQDWRVWVHPGPNSPDTSHHYTQAHFFCAGKQKCSSSRYFICVLGEQAALILNSFPCCDCLQMTGLLLRWEV